MEQGRHWDSGDFSISKAVITEGQIDVQSQPRFGSTATVIFHSNWTFDSKKFEKNQILQNSSVSVILASVQCGRDSETRIRLGFNFTEVDRTLEDAIKSMFPGETSHFNIRFNLTPKNCPSLTTVDAWVKLDATLTLRGLDNTQPIFKWSSQDKLTACEDLKLIGGQLFAEKRYYEAYLAFRQAHTLSAFVIEEKNDIDVKYEQDLNLKCLMNLVACHLQLLNYGHVVTMASYGLTKSPKNAKLLYRRGVANSVLKNYEQAIQDFQVALTLEPENKAVAQKLNQAKEKLKEDNRKLSHSLKKMFS